VALPTPDEVARLSVIERLDLIGRLWDSLDDSDVPITPAQRTELERRLTDFESDRAGGTAWADLKAELASRRR
jgi:putative addiction module component (TIGR02574 family)